MRKGTVTIVRGKSQLNQLSHPCTMMRIRNNGIPNTWTVEKS